LTIWQRFNTGANPVPTAVVTTASKPVGSPTSSTLSTPRGSISGTVTTTNVTKNIGTDARTTIQSALDASNLDVTLTLPKQSGTVALVSQTIAFAIALG
jgi:hypothetical protein